MEISYQLILTMISKLNQNVFTFSFLFILASLIFFQQMIYEIQESSDSCPQCSHHRCHKENNSSSQSQQEMQQQPDRIVIPLKKHVLQQNQNIQAALNLLHQEIEQLKKENKAKQLQIAELCQKLGEKQLLNPSRMKIPLQKTLNKTKKESIYFKKQKQGRKNWAERSPSSERSEQSAFFTCKKMKKHSSTAALHHVNYIQNKIQQINEFKNERIRQLETEINSYSELCEELKERLNEELIKTDWMSSFCVSFCNMAGQLAQMQGLGIMKPSSSLRKRTKSAWKFLKSFINEVIQ